MIVLSGLLSTPHVQADDAPIRVAFFNPQNADDPFWQPVDRFMRAAAHDLNIEVTTYVARHDRATMLQQVREAVSGPVKPDFIVFKNFKSNAPEVLKIAQEYGVKSFMFNAGLTHEERILNGGPREHYSNWIGQMLPGDELAGYNLASALIRRARDLKLVNADGKIVMAGLTGNLSDSAAIERNLGLGRALEENPDVSFVQLVPARWDHDEARQKTDGLFHRYADISVVWAANDPMALGAIKAAEQAGLQPGKTFITGGVDWNPPALQAVKDGALFTSIGGHFMEGGWVMVLLHDYVHGFDFAQDGGAARFSEMAMLTTENIDRYRVKFLNEDWDRVDFSIFSRVKNPKQKAYDFGLNRILDQL
ncbi:MAG TPA: ABC transporter substrate-binding protein [Magnetovibrio sp.]